MKIIILLVFFPSSNEVSCLEKFVHSVSYGYSKFRLQNLNNIGMNILKNLTEHLQAAQISDLHKNHIHQERRKNKKEKKFWYTSISDVAIDWLGIQAPQYSFYFSVNGPL